MNKVIEVFKTSPQASVLICEGDMPAEKGILQTAIGSFAAHEYILGTCTHCFSENPMFAVRINTALDCSQIKQVTFK